MKLTIDYLAADRLRKFTTWIAKRMKDPIHKDNANLINQFMSKVVSVELSRLEKVTDTIAEVIDIPNEIMLETLKELEKKPSGDTKKKDNVVALPNQSGNGHGKKKTRKLTDSERDIIRTEFIKINGEIKEDACLEIKKKLGPDVSIFQITGFVTYLHMEIAKGKFGVSNMNSYLIFLQGHRDRWALYKSPKYVSLRGNRAA